MISRRRGLAVITIGTAATLALIGACNDLSSPRSRPQPAAPASRSWDAPDHPSGFFTPDPLYGGFADSTTLVSHFPQQTAVYIIGAGKIVKHDQAGVLGDQSFNAASVAISETFPNGTSQILQFPNNNQQASDTIPFTMQPGTSLIKVSRGSWSPSNLTISNLYWNGRWINCSPTTTPCYTFDGGHTISVVPIPASYSARSDSQTYAIGSRAVIAMTTSPVTMIGSHTPIHVDSALWTPAPDSLGGDAADTIPLNACSNYRWDNQYSPVDWLCDHTVNGAGTLTMIGHANGFRVAPQVPITVRGPTLTLRANPVSLYAGDTVTFTPSWSDGFPVNPSAWKWQPDTLPSLISQDGGECTTSATICTRAIRQNGRMFVSVIRDGKTRTASARVTVTPPSVNLSIDRNSIGEGDTVSLQGTVIPANAAYQVVGWSFQPDVFSGGVLASRVPKTAASLPTTTKTAAQPKLQTETVGDTIITTADTTAGDSLIRAFDSGDELPPIDDRPSTIGCNNSSLHCQTPVFRAGTITLAVNIRGKVYTSNAVHVELNYVCPQIFPEPLPPGEISGISQSPADPIVTNKEEKTWYGRHIGYYTVWVYGIYELRKRMEINENGIPVAAYIPGYAKDNGGRVVFVRPWSTIEFQCRVKINPNTLALEGKMIYNNRLDIWWYAPMPAP